MLSVDEIPTSVSSALPDLAHLTLDNPPSTPSPSPIPIHTYPDGPKNSAPFQFGSRFLRSEEEVFTFNAWDHVETDAAYKAHTTVQLAAQRAKPVAEFDKKRFMSDPAKWWDLFYKNNRENFFKDRKWLQQEFPILAEATRGDEAGEVKMVELGCGAGNTLFPVLAQNRNNGFHIHGCDFSAKAVEIVKSQTLYVEQNPRGFVSASVYDLSVPDTLPEGVEEGSVDVVIMVFVFSALAPEQWSGALGNVKRMLKKGGKVLFRDYGRGDLAQVRFKAGRYLDENFYVRGDGTRVYFFDQWELRKIFTGEVGEAGEQNFGGRQQVKEPTEETKEEQGETVGGKRPAENTGQGGEAIEEEEQEEEKQGEEKQGEEKQGEEKQGEEKQGEEKQGEEKQGEEKQGEEKQQEEDHLEVEKQQREELERFPEGNFGGLVAREMGVDRRLLVNRKRQLKMYRCWMQAVFEKL